MADSMTRTDGEIEEVVQKYGDILFRICLIMLGNEADAEDAVQETVLKYIQRAPNFNNPGHEKAWLIKVAANKCRDMQRFFSRHPQMNIEDLQCYVYAPESCGIIEALMAIPEKFKIVMLLYYVEEYSIEDIAKIIGKTESAVKMRLKKGRKLLEEKYRKEYL